MTVIERRPTMYGACLLHPDQPAIRCSTCALGATMSSPALADKNRPVDGLVRCWHRHCMEVVTRAGDYCSKDCELDEQKLNRTLPQRHNTVSPTCNYVFCDNPLVLGGTVDGGYCSETCRRNSGDLTVDRPADDESFALPPGDQEPLNRYEFVNHPTHYNAHPAGIECIDVIEHMSFNVGTAMKYLWRAGLKPGEDALQDLSKAEWYTRREKERLEKVKARILG